MASNDLNGAQEEVHDDDEDAADSEKYEEMELKMISSMKEHLPEEYKQKGDMLTPYGILLAVSEYIRDLRDYVISKGLNWDAMSPVITDFQSYLEQMELREVCSEFFHSKNQPASDEHPDRAASR